MRLLIREGFVDCQGFESRTEPQIPDSPRTPQRSANGQRTVNSLSVPYRSYFNRILGLDCGFARSRERETAIVITAWMLVSQTAITTGGEQNYYLRGPNEQYIILSRLQNALTLKQVSSSYLLSALDAPPTLLQRTKGHQRDRRRDDKLW